MGNKSVSSLNIYSATVDMLDTVTLGASYDGREASPIGLQRHQFCCSGR